MINSYLTSKCSLVVQTKDQWGKVASEELVEKRCKHTASTRLVRDYKGQEVTSSGNLLLSKDVAVSPGQFIEVKGRRHLVLRVDEVTDFGTQGKKAWLS